MKYTYIKNMEANCMIIEMQPLFKYFNFGVDNDSRNLKSVTHFK